MIPTTRANWFPEKYEENPKFFIRLGRTLLTKRTSSTHPISLKAAGADHRAV
jgi:hypothetical protein